MHLSFDMSETITQIQNYIGGQFVKPIDNLYLESYNPATAGLLCHVPDSTAADVDAAVAAAQAAFPLWSKISVQERSRLLNRVADILEANLDAFAKAESADQGKTYQQAATVEIPRSIQNFRYFAGAVQHLDEGQATMTAETQSFTHRCPIGIVGLISPWNLPLYLLTWKIAPALAMGNCVVAKPSEFTSLTAFMLCTVLTQAGIPPGVVNMVFGYGAKAGQVLIQHPNVRAISFTGGTATGRMVQEATAATNKKVSLELGGKNANIILEDANLKAAVATSLRSSFANQGEICLCGSRILLQRGIAERFTELFVEAASKLKAGDPSDPDSFIGALVSKEHWAKVNSYIELARGESGRILLGGQKPADLPTALSNGYFMAPTIIADLPKDSRLHKEEIFGPVVTIQIFDTIEEAIALANSTAYGLSASVWTQSLRHAHVMARRLEVGTVWVNCWMVRDLSLPFGGVKASGVGREGGAHSLDFFSELKTITMTF